MNTKKIILRIAIVVLSVTGLHNKAYAQITLPYVFENVSEYADNEIYIGLVGQYPNMGGVWMDMTTSQLQVMEYANNTIPGPAWANTPDGQNKYAAMFYKLSDIPNKTINIPHGLFGCRVFISFRSPMYIYFHATGGYAGANLQNANDPNDGIRWELVELTWGDAGLWTNTSRVDAYQYPMALEVTGYSGGMSGTYAQSYTATINSGTAPDIFKKIGELLPHQTIIDLWETKVDEPFYACKVVKTHSMDGKPIIEQPSKIPDFKDGATYGNFFETYIDDIWATYRTQDLYLDIGDRGTWRGRVTGDRFDFYDPADNSQATIYSKPTTTNAIEGSGSLATTPEPGGSTKYHEDLMIQAQVCAAINRHAIYTDAATGEVQYNHDASRFFTIAPYNQYVKFFHDEQISYQSQTYAFAYDDVGDHSSTIQCTFPTKVDVIIGGYGTDTNPEIQEPYAINLIPGTIEAENYDKGGEGIAYSDVSPGNEGGKYRTDAVDVEECSEGGYNISHTADNEWLEYTVDVAQNGLYDFTFQTASLSLGGTLRIEVDETVQSGSISLPITTDWQIWQPTTVQNVSLNKGKHIIRMYIEQGGFNFNAVTVSPSVNTGFLHADGKTIKNAAGAHFLIKGIGTGNWMIQEGYMMQSTPVAPTQHQFRNKLIATIGETKTDEFYELWLKNHFRKIDVDSMAAWGFNAVRVALHYIWFTPPIEDEPVPGQITWNNKGFEMIDSLLSWCSSNNIYLILDMHGAPGGQGKNADISDYDETKPSLWESELNKEKLVALWSKLAQRYKDESWIGGYDLLNETNWDFENSGNQNGCACNSNTPLVEMHKRMIDAIRAVDMNHLVFVSGNCWGNNYSGMDNLFNYDANLSITFHKYWNYNNAGSINDLLTLRETANKPLWMSESGENSNTWFTDAVKLFESNNIGWSWWPVKKSGVNNILKVTTNPDYLQLIDAWNGNGTISADDAYNAVMKFADNHRFENCSIAYDVIDALIRQPSTTATRPFKEHTENQKIFAVDYDLGQNGYAYSDSTVANYHVSTNNFTAWNTGWAYRNDGVDIEECTDSLHKTNGYNIAWIEDKEWMVYTVNFTKTDIYDFVIRTASTSGGKIHIEIDGTNVSNSIFLPITNDWQTYKETKIEGLAIAQGTHTIKIYAETGGFNVNYFMFFKETTQTIALQKGWNLISINVMPDTTIVGGRDVACNISTVFANLDLEAIKTMDTFWRKGQSVIFNSLQTITPGEGYLVKMNTAGTLTVTGTPISTVAHYPNSTFSNWVLIGCPFQTPTPFSNYFNTNNCEIIKNFDGFWMPNGTMNSIQNLEAGKGYFMRK